MNTKSLANVLPHIPDSRKKLRACLTCLLIKTESQFKDIGCSNECFVSSQWPENSSPSFSGMISMMRPKDSWVARWNGIKTVTDEEEPKIITRMPGLYAIKVTDGD